MYEVSLAFARPASIGARGDRRRQRALRGGEGRGQRDHRVSSDGIRGARHPRLRGGARWYRSPTAAHPAQRRRAERPGERMDPSCRGPDDLVEPDETLWHDRGAGGGDPVPGFRMRHEEPILHLRIVLSQTTSAGIGMRGYIIVVSL